MPVWIYTIAILAGFVFEDSKQSDIVLTKSTELAQENTTVTLTCSKKNGTLLESRWQSSTFPGETATCALVGNTCLMTNFLKNNSFYDCTCNSNGTYSVNLRNVSLKQHEAWWTCREGYNKSNYVFIIVEALTLEKSSKIALENTTVTLTCSMKNGSLTESRWLSSTFPGVEAVCGFLGNTCLRTSFLNNSNSYGCTCNYNGTISVHLRQVDRLQNGAIWTCKHLGYTQSNSVVIKVAVPVTHVLLSQYGSALIHGNSTTTLQCNTSYGFPAPDIRWYRSHETSTVELLNNMDKGVHITRTNRKRDDGLTSVAETLVYRVSILVHGWNIYCVASNWEKIQVTSNRIPLSIIYPPKGSPEIQGFINGSTYNVIESTKANLSCMVEGGNPQTIPKWVCKDLMNPSTTTLIQNDTKITTSLSWTALRNQGKTCVCQTDHVLSKDFVFVYIDVLYKASVTHFYIDGYEFQQSVTVNETETIPFTCDIDSNPGAAISFSDKDRNEIFKMHDVKQIMYLIGNITCHQAGVYYCTAKNDYNYGEPSTALLLLHVKCSPRRSTGSVITNISARQYDSATFRFTAIGYPVPGPSGFIWHKLINSVWIPLTHSTKYNISSSDLQSNLTIRSVTRTDYGQYKLRIENNLGEYEQIFNLLKLVEESSDTQIIPILIGCLVSILIVAVIAIFGYRRYRMKDKGNERSNNCTSVSELQTISGNCGTEDSNVKGEPYEELNDDIANEGPKEKPEHAYETLNTDGDKSVTTNLVYTNLAF